MMFTDAFKLVLDERSAVFCWVLGCWAVLVEAFPVGDCAWLVPEAGGLVFWVPVFEGELVCAWLEGVVVWFDG